MKRYGMPAVAIALLAACTALQPPRAEVATLYLLEARPARTAAQPPRALVLAVETPHARAGYDTARMVYVRQPHKLEYYAKNRWVDTPARMLAPLLVQALAQSGAFNAVVQSSNRIGADLRLDTELVRLQQDFSTQPSRVQLSLRAQLIDTRSNRVLALRELEETEIAPSEDAYGGVMAANTALQRLLDQLVAFCHTASGAG